MSNRLKINQECIEEIVKRVNERTSPLLDITMRDDNA
jgi:hypothetical protein